jgi:hypothetical protein
MAFAERHRFEIYIPLDPETAYFHFFEFAQRKIPPFTLETDYMAIKQEVIPFRPAFGDEPGPSGSRKEEPGKHYRIGNVCLLAQSWQCTPESVIEKSWHIAISSLELRLRSDPVCSTVNGWYRFQDRSSSRIALETW